MPANLGRPVRPDRSKIHLDDQAQARYWCRHFKVTSAELRKVVEKMGNSAAAVRKELGARPVEIADVRPE